MNKKLIPILIVLILVIGGGAFYGGMKYGQLKPSLEQKFPAPEQRQGLKGLGIKSKETGVGLLRGEITAKDDQGITLKLPDGGSKIIFFSDSTEIAKTTEGTTGDLEVGKEVMVSGDQGSEGTITAKKIQIVTGAVKGADIDNSFRRRTSPAQ